MNFINKNINQLNLHSALLVLGQNLVQVFGAVYFLNKGFEPFQVLGGWALLNLFRMILRPGAHRVIRRIGLRKAIFLGTLLFAGLSFFLPLVAEPNWLFILFLLYFAICDITYWFSYHAYFSILSDGNHRGSEVCSREVLMMLAGAFAPVLGGVMIQQISFLFAATIASCLILVAALILLTMPDVKIKTSYKNITTFGRTAGLGFRLWFGWAVFYYMFSFIWSIVLFYLSGSYSLFGGLLTLEILFSVMILANVGSLIDHKKYSKLFGFSINILLIVVLFRSFIVDTFFLNCCFSIFNRVCVFDI